MFRELGLPPITDEEVDAAVAALSSVDMPMRDVVADLAAAEQFLAQGGSALDVIRALANTGFRDIAEKILTVQKLRVSGDYLQTSAIVLPGGKVASAVNDANDYAGPGSGYRVEGERWREICAIPEAPDPRTIAEDRNKDAPLLEEDGIAQISADLREVVIAIGPAFGTVMQETLLGLSHRHVLHAVSTGIRSEGMRPRIVKIRATSDCGFIGHAGAKLSGSGIAIGMQSKGTTVITRRGLEPLNNLELFPQAPNLTLESYRAIGRNAARYAKSEPVLPVPVQIDNMARLKYIVPTTILHLKETAEVSQGADPKDVRIVE